METATISRFARASRMKFLLDAMQSLYREIEAYNRRVCWLPNLSGVARRAEEVALHQEAARLEESQRVLTRRSRELKDKPLSD